MLTIRVGAPTGVTAGTIMAVATKTEIGTMAVIMVGTPIMVVVTEEAVMMIDSRMMVLMIEEAAIVMGRTETETPAVDVPITIEVEAILPRQSGGMFLLRPRGIPVIRA